MNFVADVSRPRDVSDADEDGEEEEGDSGRRTTTPEIVRTLVGVRTSVSGQGFGVPSGRKSPYAPSVPQLLKWKT